MDLRVNNGCKPGENRGQGRPPKVVEETANYIFMQGLKRFFNSEEEEEAKINFVKDLLETPRGKIFIAEHIFGKPTQSIDQNTKINFSSFNIKEVVQFSELP